jgi:UDP-2,3-diacylglucosamine hydrolase
MRLIAISDLHVSGPEDPLYRDLLALTDSLQSGDAFVAAGDLFDLFVGAKKVFLDRYSEFISKITAAAERGASFHYVEGNHDFLLKRAFPKRKGIKVYGRDALINFGGKRFYFAHGDLVNTTNYKYRFMRMFFRSPLVRLLFLLVPGSFIDRIGRGMSHDSRQRTRSLPSANLARFYEKQRRIFRNFAATKLMEGCDYVIVGHLHDADEMRFQIGERSGQYVNIGDSRGQRSYLVWKDGDDGVSRAKLPSAC